MITLKTVFIRFYRSFNFDYIRRYQDSQQGTRWPWENDLEDRGEKVWYPYIEVPIDDLVTTVVGANESGKSHLLDAIEKGLFFDSPSKADESDQADKNNNSKKLKRTHFCRYSKFFALKAGQIKLPYIGYEWHVGANDNHYDDISRIISRTYESKDSFSFFMFRVDEKFEIYLNRDRNSKPSTTIEEDKREELIALLPKPIRIDSDTELPDSIPISRILEYYLFISKQKSTDLGIDQADLKKYNNLFTKSNRQVRINLTGHLEELSEAVENHKPENKESTDDTLTKIVKEIARDLHTSDLNEEVIVLIYKLLTEVAGLDIRSLFDLAEYMISSEEGQIRASIGQINKYLASSLNLRKWWVQDKEFQLVVSAKDYDLGLAVRDRTGTEYSFSERSQGLRYFLSYFIQYKAQTYKDEENRQYLLLMDEPDQYLSSQAQHSLLQIFEAFANPKEEKRDRMQVVYVTHSPFLVDRNLPSRVRLLYKGVDDEGTRLVVQGRNFYEPLRSAFGTLMAEDAFAGNCNIIVESKAEITILTALSHWLHLNRDKYKVGSHQNLDLNQLTLISSEGSESLYDLLYISRGRSQTEKPAVVVLSSHKNNLLEYLEHNEKKSLLDTHLVQKIADIQDLEDYNLIEELIPTSIWLAAANLYLKSFLSVPEESLLTLEDIDSSEDPILTRIKEKIQNKFKLTPSNIGLAKSLLDYLQDSKDQDSEEWSELAQNFKALFGELSSLVDTAIEGQTKAKILDKVKRITQQFLDDYERILITFDNLHDLLEKIEKSLDDTEESDRFGRSIKRIRKNPSYSKNKNLDPNGKIEPKEDLLDLLRKEFCLPEESEESSSVSPAPDEVNSDQPSSTIANSASKESTSGVPFVPSNNDPKKNSNRSQQSRNRQGT